ncbi:MAG: PSD1 domain-containing protein [Verrucomicrobia bacterium]|nr:PSD1 domain-containing protein [Verrucomicrobiota bacterium]
MSKSRSPSASVFVFVCLVVPTGVAPLISADAAEDTPELLFVRRIAPLLREKCLACHGNDEKKIKGGLDLRTFSGAMKGGDSGKPALVAGKPETSPLYLAVARTNADWEPMPPKEADKLNLEQIQWIKDWVTRGGSWPDDTRAKQLVETNAKKWSAEDGVAVKTSGGLSPEWTNRKYKPEALWAYQPVRKPLVPMIGKQYSVISGWNTEVRGEKTKLNTDALTTDHSPANPIDAFILAKLPAGLQPGLAADRRTLIRRATFDLTGLPPKPEDVDTFVKDPLPDAQAFVKVVERLLGSPHYGERMAQHWLDVVRYADSSGFANDYERGNAWRYRDYVVRSFNQDKPYDRFVREQIAGDELDPNNPEMLVATGFLRMGPWELTGMEVPKIARQRFLDDAVTTVGETFLAHSLQCARCHDHKFDPVPTRDYYSIQAVFATTQLAERAAPFLSEENLSGFQEKRFLEQRRQEYLATLSDLDEKMLKAGEAWYREKGLDPAKWNAAVEKARGQPTANRRRPFSDVFSAARSALTRQGVPEGDFPPKFVGFSPEDYGNERVARKGLERLRWEMERYEPFALAVYSGYTPDVKNVSVPVRVPANRMTEGELEETCILPGGDPFSPGQKVQPAALSAITAFNPQSAISIPQSPAGRRKAFAEWVTSAENPLTARAIANRIWLWHFNRPIAGNPNNFGSTGQKPTHAELLDWLAAAFVEQGWSFKAMHRLVMNSETYRRSSVTSNQYSVVSNQLSAGTSLNTDALISDYLTFRPRRLTAEELRDAMLASAGELNPALGGIPNRPEINLEAALQPRQVMGTFAAAWTPNPLPEQRHRRSLYALKLRGLPDPWLEVFNAPALDFSCERREASTVTPQVFSLFNSQNSHARALALANRARKETKNDEQAVARCFALALSRKPTADELTTCLGHWREIEAMLGNAAPVGSKPPLKVRREAIEENTGERFTFTEKLHAYAEFVPDLQPADVPAHTRALADVCLALFNSNEFAYVY